MISLPLPPLPSLPPSLPPSLLHLGATAFFVVSQLLEEVTLECVFPEGITDVHWTNDSGLFEFLPAERNNTAVISLLATEAVHGHIFRCSGRTQRGQAVHKLYRVVVRGEGLVKLQATINMSGCLHYRIHIIDILTRSVQAKNDPTNAQMPKLTRKCLLTSCHLSRLRKLLYSKTGPPNKEHHNYVVTFSVGALPDVTL